MFPLAELSLGSRIATYIVQEVFTWAGDGDIRPDASIMFKKPVKSRKIKNELPSLAWLALI